MVQIHACRLYFGKVAALIIEHLKSAFQLKKKSTQRFGIADATPSLKDNIYYYNFLMNLS